MDWATKKIQLLTLLPQLCPIFLLNKNKNGNLTLEDVAKRKTSLLGLKLKNEQQHQQFLQDLCTLADFDWPFSKKNTVTYLDGNAGRFPNSAVNVDPVQKSMDDTKDHDHKEKRRMCQSHKKIWVLLKRDKFRRQFLRELLTAGKTMIMITKNTTDSSITTAAEKSHVVDIDDDTDIVPLGNNTSPERPEQPLQSVPEEIKKSVSVVKLLKLGLKSRYSSHLRKSFKERDVHGTICILSIIANMNEDEYEKMKETKEKKVEMIFSLDQTVDYNDDDDNVLKGSNFDKNEENVLFHSKQNSELNKSQMLNADSTPIQYYKTVLIRVFNYLKSNPKIMFKMCQLMENIHSYEALLGSEKLHSTYLIKTEHLHKFRKQMQRLDNLWKLRLKFLTVQDINLKKSTKNELSALSPTTLEDNYKRFSLSKRILELENSLSSTKSRWENIFLKREKEIKLLKKELLPTRIEMENNLLETVKHLDAEKILQSKAHQHRLQKMDINTNAMKQRLSEAVATIDIGYRGLRSYRKGKETELREAIKEYNHEMARKRQQLNELSETVKENDAEMGRLDQIWMEMEETYDEMKTTRRLRELLLNMKMAESVRENWAARRIQTAWKRYKTRKLRKRKLKKPKRKKKDTSSGGGLFGFFGMDSKPKTIAERRVSVKKF